MIKKYKKISYLVTSSGSTFRTSQLLVLINMRRREWEGEREKEVQKRGEVGASSLSATPAVVTK
jgi:hypothetical protein